MVEVTQLVGSPPAPVKVMVHKVVAPDLRVTVPVAAALMPDSAKVAWAPKALVAEVLPFTVVVNVVGAALTVRATVLSAGGTQGSCRRCRRRWR